MDSVDDRQRFLQRMDERHNVDFPLILITVVGAVALQGTELSAFHCLIYAVIAIHFLSRIFCIEVLLEYGRIKSSFIYVLHYLLIFLLFPIIIGGSKGHVKLMIPLYVFYFFCLFLINAMVLAKTFRFMERYTKGLEWSLFFQFFLGICICLPMVMSEHAGYNFYMVTILTLSTAATFIFTELLLRSRNTTHD